MTEYKPVMKTIVSSVILLAAMPLAAVSLSTAPPTTAGVTAQGPFVGIELSKLSEDDRSVIVQASEDFRAVVAGRKPVHAVFDKEHPLPADGGTTFYKGNRYKLTIQRSISSFGSFTGIAYGPVLRFEQEFAPGNVSQLSDIRVYSFDELRKLLAE